MKEVNHDKGLYTDAEFDQAIADGKTRREDGAEPSGSALISDEDARQITVITLMRIYDMLGMILNKLDPEAAEAVAEKHAAGELVGPLPSLNI